MKTLHAVPCKLCNRRSVTYGGWCPICLVRGVKSMQAMSAPLMTFLLENHAVKPGDNMPYGEDLLGKLRGILDAEKATQVPYGPVLNSAPGTPETNPTVGTGDGPHSADRPLSQ